MVVRATLFSSFFFASSLLYDLPNCFCNLVCAVKKSWVPVAADSDFSLQNLPYGVFRPTATPTAAPHIGYVFVTALFAFFAFESIDAMAVVVWRSAIRCWICTFWPPLASSTPPSTCRTVMHHHMHTPLTHAHSSHHLLHVWL
jgi:hypothetical protein